jgi:hypothetical protein
MRALFALLAVSALLVPATAGAGVKVTNDRTAVSTKLGQKFVFHTRIANDGSTPAAGLVAHLNVVDLTGNTYVDPEDWSSHRTRYLAPVAPGGSTTLSWRLKRGHRRHRRDLRNGPAEERRTGAADDRPDPPRPDPGTPLAERGWGGAPRARHPVPPRRAGARNPFPSPLGTMPERPATRTFTWSTTQLNMA